MKYLSIFLCAVALSTPSFDMYCNTASSYRSDRIIRIANGTGPRRKSVSIGLKSLTSNGLYVQFLVLSSSCLLLLFDVVADRGAIFDVQF